ncbi:MAG: outer membrane protein assembly factor BamE [Pseudomonadota bacterium]
MVFKLPTRQGNVIEQKQLDQLKLGMTRQQVTYLMGTPIASSPFRTDRWDYLGYYKSPRGVENNRNVILYFEKDVLARMEGTAPIPVADAKPSTPSISAIFKQQKKEKNEDERSESAPEGGVILTQPSNTP